MLFIASRLRGLLVVLLILACGALRAQPPVDQPLGPQPPTPPQPVAGAVEPDIQLSLAGLAQMVGARVINPTEKYNGDGQRLQTTIPLGTVVPVQVAINNLGEKFGDCLVTVPVAENGWKVKGFSYGWPNDADITAVLNAKPGHQIRLQAKGMSMLYLLIEAPAQASTLTTGIRARSVQDPTKADYVEIAVTCADLPRPAADLLVKRAGADDYLGGDTFTVNAPFQRVMAMSPADKPAVYLVKLKNTTHAEATFRVTVPVKNIPPPYQGLSITVFDAERDGAEVTPLAGSPDGWQRTLPAGGETVFRVEIVNGSKTDRLMYELVVSAALDEKPRDVLDQARLSYFSMPANGRPDLMLKLPEDPAYAGEGVVWEMANPNKNQQMTIPAEVEKTTPVLIRLRNVGPKPQAFRMLATRGVPGFIQVQFFDAAQEGKEITAEITAGGWTTPEIAPKATLDLRMEVTPRRRGNPYACALQAFSLLNPIDRDMIIANITTQPLPPPPPVIAPPPPPAKPDLMVKRPQDKAYSGANAYAAPGDANIQTITATLPLGKTLVVDVKVRNNGDAPCAFRIGPCIARDGWETHYYDLLDGTEITDAVRAGAWSTGDLRPGEAKDLRLELVTGAALGAENSLALPLAVTPVNAKQAGTDAILFKLTREAAK